MPTFQLVVENAVLVYAQTSHLYELQNHMFKQQTSLHLWAMLAKDSSRKEIALGKLQLKLKCD